MTYQDNIKSIVIGLNKAAEIITSTMGAEGKTVAIVNNNELRFTKDGVSVARSIHFDDPFENVGAKILISAANETVKQVGDGTTLTSLFLKEMINTLMDTQDINRTLDVMKEDIDNVVKQIQDKKHIIESIDEIQSIATISSNSEAIGKLFTELYKEASFDSLIKLEKSTYTNYSYFEVLKGIQYDSGFVHPSFKTNKDTEEAIYENALVYLAKESLTSISEEIKQFVGATHEQQVPLIIIAPDFSDAFIRFASMNKVNNGIEICLVRTPGSTNHSKNKNVEDIQAFLSEEGYVDKIIVSAYTTTLFNEDTPNLETRLNTLRSLKESAVEWWEEEDYEKRIHKLRGSSAIIYAGGVTPEALSEEYDRIEDAVGATQSAIRNGYVYGGGYTLYNLKANTPALQNILKQPVYTILDNANIDIKTSDIEKNIKDNKLYNVRTKQWEDVSLTNIYDPADVLISALTNAYSNTKLIINTSYIINV